MERLRNVVGRITQNFRSHIFSIVCWIYIIISGTSSGPTISLQTTFHLNLRDEGVKHWFICQRMPLLPTFFILGII